MIFVFKTSVRTKMQARKLKLHLDKILSDARWNFDLEDCDKILRIDSKEDVVLKITDLLHRHHYSCEELE